MASLLNISSVHECWDIEELWGIIAELVVFISMSEDPSGLANINLPRVISPPKTIVAFPVANISWEGAPMRLGGKSVIGKFGTELTEHLRELVASNDDVAEFEDFASKDGRNRSPVYFATIVKSQQNKAFEDASRQLEILADIAILLDEQKSEHKLHSSRGAWNRPGVRGLMLDRTAVEKALSGVDSGVELYSKPFMSNSLGTSSAVRWYSANPVPLEVLLGRSDLREAAVKCLSGSGSVYRRLRVAARWFAEAFWASGADDAALALGVALDALIGSKGALPGRAMKERFALLEEDPQIRGSRAKRYEEIFSVRSAVAHGGDSKKLRENDFVRGIEDEVTWAAWRLIAAQEVFEVSSDAEIDALFEGLRWGTRTWRHQ